MAVFKKGQINGSGLDLTPRSSLKAPLNPQEHTGLAWSVLLWINTSAFNPAGCDLGYWSESQSLAYTVHPFTLIIMAALCGLCYLCP